jgi:plasmid stabilization system protein ParE
MVYAVRITATAEEELEAAYAWIHKRAPLNAERWRLRLIEQTATLGRLPDRCPLAPESKGASCEVRHLVFGNYRILFTIARRTVYVVHIRHGARRRIRPEEPGLP